MKTIPVFVSCCAMIVEGADKAILYALWQATKDLKSPYRIARLVKTSDAEKFLITVL